MAAFRHRYVGSEKIRSLVDFDEKVRARLRAAIDAQAQDLLTRSQALASGGALHVRKGRLLRSLKMKPYESEFGFGARVFSGWYIGRFWEQGFGHGKSFNVKAHVREVKSRSRTGIVKAREGKRRTSIKYGQTAAGIAFVKAHKRVINQPARSFLKAALDPMRGQIRSALAQAVKG